MSSNPYLGVVSIERFLTVEQYRDSHQTAASLHPLPNRGPAGRGRRATANRPRADGAWASVR
jgi:hypothetical protein